MELSPKTVRLIVIAVGVVILAVFLLGILWDLLWKILGLAIGLGLIALGFRFLFGKGLPDSLAKWFSGDEK